MGMKKEIAELALAVIIALAAYQAVGFLFGTTVPVTSVVTPSMEHSADFADWWDANNAKYSALNITKEDFLSFPYRKGLYVGDMVIVMKTNDLKKGDVIVYHPLNGCFEGISTKATIIHRLVSVEPLVTKGDNNPRPDMAGDKNCIVSVEGKAVAISKVAAF